MPPTNRVQLDPRILHRVTQSRFRASAAYRKKQVLPSATHNRQLYACGCAAQCDSVDAARMFCIPLRVRRREAMFAPVAGSACVWTETRSSPACETPPQGCASVASLILC